MSKGPQVTLLTIGGIVAVAAGATPKDVLQLRYAGGEITREQYREILADLT